MYGQDERDAGAGAIERGFTGLVVGLNSIGTAWIFALMLIVNVDVIMRFVFRAPIQGVTEIVELSIVGIVFLQISDAVRRGRLTRSDGLYSRFSNRYPTAGGIAGIIFDLLGAAFFIALLFGGVPRLIEAWERGYFVGNEGLFTAPLWPIRLILVVGCAVVTCQFLVLAFRRASRLRQRSFE